MPTWLLIPNTSSESAGNALRPPQVAGRVPVREVSRRDRNDSEGYAPASPQLDGMGPANIYLYMLNSMIKNVIIDTIVYVCICVYECINAFEHIPGTYIGGQAADQGSTTADL